MKTSRKTAAIEYPDKSGGGSRISYLMRHTEKCVCSRRRPLDHDPEGSVTVFLALTIAVLLPLILTLVEGARMNAVRMKTEIAGNIAVRSVLGEFHQELLRQYDLYFVDTSYGEGVASVDNVQRHLRHYMEKNLDTRTGSVLGLSGDMTGTRLESLTVDGTRFAADNGARALREQVYAYMSADPAGRVLADILTEVDTWEGLLDEGTAWEEQRAEAREDLREGIRQAREDAQANHTHEERQAAREEGDNTAEEAIREMDRFCALPILRQVFGDTSGISTATVGHQVLSGRGIHYGGALRPANSHGYPRADEALFDLYLGEKCGTYTAPLEKARLKYQIEYILAGQKSDRRNLEKVAERLLLIREAVNCAYLFTDSARTGQAETMAMIVSLVLLNPELKDLFKTVLIFAWAYLESIQDLRTLFDGGRVPLWKSSDTWKTPLLGILAPQLAIRGGPGNGTGGSGNGGSGSGSDSAIDAGGTGNGGSGGGTGGNGSGSHGQGLSYGEYLQALLYLEGSSVKSLRAMDIMEMDIRQTPGNSGFCMDWCLDAFSMTAAVKSRFGYQFELKKCEGYN